MKGKAGQRIDVMARHLVPDRSDQSSWPVSSEPASSSASGRRKQGETLSSYERQVCIDISDCAPFPEARHLSGSHEQHILV